jgi:hypothetical protein
VLPASRPLSTPEGIAQVITPVRRALAGAVCASLLVGTAACSGGPPTPTARSSAPDSPSTGSSATLTAAPVPLEVRVTRVSGTLSPRARGALERNVRRTVSAYLDAAFLGGTYPRSDFSDSFGAFTAGARQQARHDVALLTNKELGPTAESVTPKVQAAYLSVLAPYKVAAGVTARLRLRFVADQGAQGRTQVTVHGRLLLTRKKSGGWAIFGYDLSRSARTVGKES